MEFCFFHPRDPKRSPIRSTWTSTYIHAVIGAIRAAWLQIESYEYYRSDSFEPVHYNDEDNLTTKIAEILNDRLDYETTGVFRKEVFQTVVRDGKQSSAELDSIDQMPDLTFRFVRTASGEDREESALYVEAKLLSAVGGCSAYVMKGLNRFITGKYAPRVSFGVMLGYCTTDFNDPTKCLADYFAAAPSAAAKRCSSPVVSNPAGYLTTNHSRNPPASVSFKTYHVWLERPVVLPPMTP